MKRMTIITILLIVAFLFLAGCSNSTDKQSDLPGPSDNPSGQQNQQGSSGNKAGFVFEANGITIAVNEEVEPIIEKLGEPMEYFEAESCAIEGMEKVYTYSGFEIHTYELDGVDYVLSVVFLDDSVATKEGIYLYSDLNSMLEAYGDDYTKTNNQYTYTSGSSQLNFIIENDEVASIEYMAIIEQ
ncbi:MAG TPA: hypothetical protein GX505_01425 [Clostridiales bacterium]|nr:hypothetical protein [Clostridiales bacterium]